MLGKIAAYLQICDSVMISLLLYHACLWCLLPCMSSCSVYKQNVNGMVFALCRRMLSRVHIYIAVVYGCKIRLSHTLLCAGWWVSVS